MNIMLKEIIFLLMKAFGFKILRFVLIRSGISNTSIIIRFIGLNQFINLIMQIIFYLIDLWL